jgi:hypothetical protein
LILNGKKCPFTIEWGDRYWLAMTGIGRHKQPENDLPEIRMHIRIIQGQL